MSDKKISQLPASTTPLGGTEELAVVQSGDTKKVSVADLTAGRAVSASSVVTPIINNSGDIKVQISGDDQLLVSGTNGNLAIGGSLIPYNKLELGTTGANNSVGIGMRARNGSNADSPATSIITSYDSTGGATGSKLEISTRDGSGVLVGLTVKPNRNVEVNLGNLVIGTAGKGIDFSADSSAAGMTSELLDDYEEGTWTGALASAGGSITTATTNTGKYTKIGRQVTASMWIDVDSVLVPSGELFLTGLPFTNGGALTNRTAVTVWANNLAAGAITSITAFMFNNQSQINLARFNAGVYVNDLASYVQATTRFYVSATYFIN